MADDIPARFRKTKTGKWAVMAPIDALEKALAEGGKVDVQKKSGDWSTFVVASLGRPFDVDGVKMCYGYGPEDDDESEGGPVAGGGRTAPQRPRADAPPTDPSEPLPEYQGGAEDEWDGF